VAEKTGKAWTNEEDERLRELVVSEAEFANIAKSLCRTEKAVKARAYILGLSLRRIVSGVAASRDGAEGEENLNDLSGSSRQLGTIPGDWA
jgi:hypothetical protein